MEGTLPKDMKLIPSSIIMTYNTNSPPSCVVVTTTPTPTPPKFTRLGHEAHPQSKKDKKNHQIESFHSSPPQPLHIPCRLIPLTLLHAP